MVTAAALGLFLSTTANAAAPVDDRRREEVQALNTELLSRPSATETLAKWCGDHHLADEPKIVAIRVAGASKPPSAETLALLGGVTRDQVRYRHVELRCGARALSEADNWYRPDRLTREMNRSLETSETPFGVVVRPLNFTRRTLEVTHLTLPVREWLQSFVLRHRALLSTGAGDPFSVVEESYTPEVLADIAD